MNSRNAADAKKSSSEAKDDRIASGSGESGRWPSLEEFVEAVVGQCGVWKISATERLERELELPRGALVAGAPEKGFLSAREFIEQIRRVIDPP